MTTYTDDEIREALLRAAKTVGCFVDETDADSEMAEQDEATLRWLASEYPRLKADAEALLERLKHLVAVVPEPEMIGGGFDHPPEHASQEDHEIGYALHLARATIAVIDKAKQP